MWKDTEQLQAPLNAFVQETNAASENNSEPSSRHGRLKHKLSDDVTVKVGLTVLYIGEVEFRVVVLCLMNRWGLCRW